MSVDDTDPGGPIDRGSPLGRALGGYDVPELPAGFADRVLAAAEGRPAPLPPLRRPAPIASRRWRIGQRVVIGLASFGALATAAAATGLLEQLAIPVPSAKTMWASLTGEITPPPPPKAAAPAPVVAIPSPAPVTIERPIDTPEELQEAFRRVDQARAGRRAERRVLIDQRLQAELERRRAAGLPVPSPEEQARLRQRIEAELVRAEQAFDQRTATRRAQMQRKVEAGEPLVREDITGPEPHNPDARGWRQMRPEQRREAWRNLSPEQRRALIEAARARRAEAGPSPAPPPQE